MNAIHCLVLLGYCKNVAHLVITAIPKVIWVTNMAIGMAWVSLWNATSLCEGTNEILSVCPKLASLNHCSAVIQFVVPGGADSSSGITCTITAHQQLPVELDWVARWMVIKFICAGFHMGSTLRWRMLCFFFFARRLCFTLSHLKVFFSLRCVSCHHIPGYYTTQPISDLGKKKKHTIPVFLLNWTLIIFCVGNGHEYFTV